MEHWSLSYRLNSNQTPVHWFSQPYWNWTSFATLKFKGVLAQKGRVCVIEDCKHGSVPENLQYMLCRAAGSYRLWGIRRNNSLHISDSSWLGSNKFQAETSLELEPCNRVLCQLQFEQTVLQPPTTVRSLLHRNSLMDEDDESESVIKLEPDQVDL